MVPRKALATQLPDWVGTDKLTLVDPGRGWPAYFDCKASSGTVRLVAYMGQIGLSHRGRDEIERRFQNPGKDHPILEPKRHEIPLMLGMFEIKKRRVLVGMDAYKRIGKLTRQSLFIPLKLMESAVKKGWDEHMSAADERLVAFVPQLLPLFVEAYPSARPVTDKEIQAALS